MSATRLLVGRDIRKATIDSVFFILVLLERLCYYYEGRLRVLTVGHRMIPRLHDTGRANIRIRLGVPGRPGTPFRWRSTFELLCWVSGADVGRCVLATNPPIDGE